MPPSLSVERYIAGEALINFNSNTGIGAACRRTHNSAHSLCNTTLLADNATHIVFRNMQMINNNAFFIWLVYVHADSVRRFHQTLGDRNKKFLQIVFLPCLRNAVFL